MRTLLFCLVLGLALASVKGEQEEQAPVAEAEAVVVNSNGEADATEVADSDSDAETPSRQAQRAHVAERQQHVLTMRMQQVQNEATISTEAEAAAGTETERRRIRRWRKRGGRDFAHRVSGAARSFAPNDRMCVLCQFLVQRSQQDFAGMYGVNVGPEGLSAGLATAAATTPSVFVFMEEEGQAGELEAEEAADEDEEASEEEDEAGVEEAEELEAEEAEEADDEAEEDNEDEEESEEATEEEAEEETEEDSEEAAEEDSEDEGESEEESESEDEDEAAAFLQIAEQEEGEEESEWTTPEYKNEAVAITPSLIEQRAAARADNEGEWTTPDYLPEAAHEEVEMETAEVAEEGAQAEEVTTSAEAPHDQVEAAFFESSAVVVRAKEEGEDESETAEESSSSSEWTTPEYSLAEKAATAVRRGADAGEEEGGAEWQAPEYSDAQSAPTGVKEYAKVIIPANAAETPSSGILLEAATETETETERRRRGPFRPRYLRRFGPRRARNPYRWTGREDNAHGTVAATPKRYKISDRLTARPRWNRYDPYSPRHPNPQREAARQQFERATHLAYDRLEAYCSTRLPELFGKFCRVVLRRFRRVAEGLRYGDRPNQVCMAIKMCPQGAYIRKSPHNVLKRFHNHP